MKQDAGALSLKVEQLPIGKIVHYARNSKIHPRTQIEDIKGSIAEFGFVNPVLVDANGVLIAGHGRALAAAELGMKTIPTIRLGHLTDIQAKALRIADNQIPTRGEWNTEMLKVELGDLKVASFDLPLLGFDDIEIVDFMTGIPGNKRPKTSEKPVQSPTCRTGDVWLLGGQRLSVADKPDHATDAAILRWQEFAKAKAILDGDGRQFDEVAKERMAK